MPQEAKECRRWLVLDVRPIDGTHLVWAATAHTHSRLPLEDLLKVILLRIWEICLSCLVVGRGDVVHEVVDNLVDLIGVDVNQAWWNLASLRILQVLEVEWRYVTLLADVDHTACLALREELVDTHTEL